MPTLNLGRVRFNWRGAYDPLTDYLEYDCVEDDGQSYVCIAPVTGTGPNETGGDTYWGSMLIRSADYNQARDDAIAAADAAGDSASAAASSESTATGAANTATAARDKAQEWAEKMDGEVEPGLRSSRYWAEEAQNFGDPNLLDVTADQTSDTRQLNEWTAQILATQQTANSYQAQIDDANDNADAALLASQNNTQAIEANDADIASLVAITATAFIKADGARPAWTAPTASTLETASDLALVVGSTIVEIAAGTAVTLPALSAGTDYTIYASDAGALQAVDADSAAPAGERVVGGFHVSAGGTAIVDSSLWDLNWRPASDPRAMVLSLDGRVWADIYLMDVDYGLNGYSRNGAQIADDNDRPIIPDAYGGNGTDTYGSMSWWVALDLATAAGKRLPLYDEFTAFAYGVVERQAVGTDPGTTQHQSGHRSACGVEQVTGVMQQWGSGASATAGSSWNNIAEGRGDVYASNLKAPLFGANWVNGSSAGSRASRWSYAPDDSDSYSGARAVSDHLNLQAER
ncbi:MAG: hypothetical protein ACQEUM_07315 [Pseudomonadota bacterium]